MKRVGILTGGGDVPGLNVVIKTVTELCAEDGLEVVGLRRGWGGIVAIDPRDPASRADLTVPLDREVVRKIDRTGGTFLHSSRVNPSHLRTDALPPGSRVEDFPRVDDTHVDVTSRVAENLQALGIDSLVVTGGDDTLGYAAVLDRAGFPTIGVPKTMDNDVPGTEYCLGFSTAITRSVEMIQDLRTPAGSHERIAVIELFGRNSGATALTAGYLSNADRVLIAEVPFEMERLATMLAEDQDRSPSDYAILVVSEGARATDGEVVQGGEVDAYGHRKLGGIGAWIAQEIKRRTGRPTLEQRLAYLMRSGQPDALDRMVATNFSHLAFQLLREGRGGKMTALVNGVYRAADLPQEISGARPVDVDHRYDRQNYRPRPRSVEGLPMFLT